MSWIIRTAEPEDAQELPKVECSAGQRFRAIPALAWLADEDEMSVDAHRRFIAAGTEWVALNDALDVVGFLAAETVHRELHLWELAVRFDAQNKGVGRLLIEAASAFARKRLLKSLTLTTFAHVPWNAPWYSRLGFEAVRDDERLAALLRAESERGWPGRCAMRMTLGDPVVTAGDAPEVEAFLAQRIYEYNAEATGYFDGKPFSATRRNEAGVIQAGISGYTWGGCCYISHLWVEASVRGCGVGAALLRAAEEYAESTGCTVVFLATHTFQAPGFYERMGYETQTIVEDHPIGHASIILAKNFRRAAPAITPARLAQRPAGAQVRCAEIIHRMRNPG